MHFVLCIKFRASKAKNGCKYINLTMKCVKNFSIVVYKELINAMYTILHFAFFSSRSYSKALLQSHFLRPVEDALERKKRICILLWPNHSAVFHLLCSKFKSFSKEPIFKDWPTFPFVHFTTLANFEHISKVWLGSFRSIEF